MDRKPLLGNAQLNKDWGSKENFDSPFEIKQNVTSVYIILHITSLGRKHEKSMKQGQLKYKTKLKPGIGAVI